MTKYILATKEQEERVRAPARDWAKHEDFGLHATEEAAVQIITEYLLNDRGFTTFEEKASYD